MENLLKINNLDEFIINNNNKKEEPKKEIEEPKKEIEEPKKEIEEPKKEKEEIIINNNWWYPSKNGKKRILWAGTHIHQSNGYSRVMYYITKYLGNYE